MNSKNDDCKIMHIVLNKEQHDNILYNELHYIKNNFCCNGENICEYCYIDDEFIRDYFFRQTIERNYRNIIYEYSLKIDFFRGKCRNLYKKSKYVFRVMVVDIKQINKNGHITYVENDNV